MCSVRGGEGGGWFRVGRARGGEGGEEEGGSGGCWDSSGDGRGEGVASGFSGGLFVGGRHGVRF